MRIATSAGRLVLVHPTSPPDGSRALDVETAGPVTHLPAAVGLRAA